VTQYIPNSIETDQTEWRIPQGVDPALGYSGVPRPWVKGIRILDKPADEVAEERNGFRENSFPNTEFIIKKEQTDTIAIVVGESWVYGGRHRDMVTGMNSTESIESFQKAVNVTLGSRIAYHLNADLHQSAWPGDHTCNMFMKMEKLVDHYATRNDYSKIRVAVQVTDFHRDSNQHNLYKGTDLYNMVEQYEESAERGEPKPSTEQWLAEYDSIFLQWAERVKNKYPLKDIDIVVWKNFNPWAVDESDYAKYDVGIVHKDWSTFSADLEGVSLGEHKRLVNNAACLDKNLSIVARITEQSLEFRKQQTLCIEKLYDYYADGSASRLGMLCNYPDAVNHNLWAIQICKAGEWL
jgi:hypothetical protein